MSQRRSSAVQFVAAGLVGLAAVLASPPAAHAEDIDSNAPSYWCIRNIPGAYVIIQWGIDPAPTSTQHQGDLVPAPPGGCMDVPLEPVITLLDQPVVYDGS